MPLFWLYLLHKCGQKSKKMNHFVNFKSTHTHTQNTNTQTWKQTSKYRAWVQNPIAGFCGSLLSLVRYLEPWVKRKTNKSSDYLKSKRKLITSSYNVIITLITYHVHNKDDYYPKLTKTQSTHHKHNINMTS